MSQYSYSITMENLVTELIKQYKTKAILSLVAVCIVIWVIAHIQANPGDKVSILWGMVEYTKSKPLTNTTLPVLDQEELKEATSSTTEHQSLPISKVTIDDITLNLDGCAYSDQKLVCHLLITSATDTQPNAFIIHIKGDYKSKIVDSDGKEYYASSVQLGQKKNTRFVEDRLYAQIPKKALLYFEKISLTEKIPVLEVEGYLLPNIHITALFRDIPLPQ